MPERLDISTLRKGIPAAVLEESPESWERVIGVGLRGMKERLGQLGGKLQISSTEHGATLTAMVPVPESSKSVQVSA